MSVWLCWVLATISPAAPAAPAAVTASGPELVLPPNHVAAVSGIVRSPNGTLLASIDGHAVTLWDVASRFALRVLTGHQIATGAAFAPDGESLVTVDSGGTIRFWDVRSGALTRTLKTRNDGEGLRAVAFAPDGQSLMVSMQGRNQMRRWDLATGQESRPYIGHRAYIQSMLFSPDGKTVYSASDDHSIGVWDVATRELTDTLLGHEAAVTAIAISPDGKTLASTGDSTLRLWDLARGEQTARWTTQWAGMRSVAFSADGRQLLSGNAYFTALWDVASGKVLKSMGPTDLLKVRSDDVVQGVVWASDGRTAIASTARDLIAWDLDRAQEAGRFARNATVVTSRAAFAPDGKSLLLQDMRWDFQSGRPGLVSPGLTGRIATLCAMTPSGSHALFRRTGGLLVVDTATGAASALPGFCGLASPVALSQDGTRLLSTDGGAIAVWDVARAAVVRRFKGQISKEELVVWAADGRMVATGSTDGLVRLWDAASGSVVRVLRKGATPRPTALAFSPDSRRLAVADEQGAVQVLQLATGQPVARLRGHEGWVRAVVWSSDGASLVTGGDDRTVRVWDLARQHERLKIDEPGEAVNDLALAPDGKTIASSSYDGATRLWRMADGGLIASLVWLQNNAWVVAAPDGRFDASDLEEVGDLYWRLPERPLAPVPLEALMKDYYEPALLARLMRGAAGRALRPLAGLNIAQPVVRIVGVKDGPGPDMVSVSVEAAGAGSTGANDMRLFRDGQLVGHADGPLAAAGAAPWRKTFQVRLPTHLGPSTMHYSAYAFSDERIKSATARSTSIWVGERGPAARAYIISIGVNHHDDPAWNLSYAANDARQLQRALSAGLARSGRYGEVVPIALISDGDVRGADKAVLQAILGRLAGEPAPDVLRALPNADRIAPAGPNDLVILSFAGHGHADAQGSFYLLTQDTGLDTGRQLSDDLRRRSISSDELSRWMRDIDAGDIVMVIDACHSAASVDSGDFVPGPMGSRGLGQLAFDKGMRLLAASQANEFALESKDLAQGLLSFALAKEGLGDFAADSDPRDGTVDLDEWLRYGVARVPQLAQSSQRANAVQAGAGLDAGDLARGARLVGRVKASPDAVAQRPVLFDFKRAARGLVIDKRLQ